MLGAGYFSVFLLSIVHQTNTFVLTSKLPNLGTTIFTRMSRLAAQENAVNLSQGFPDFNCHPELMERVTYHMRAGRNQYAPSSGLMPLRERIAEKVEAAYGYAPHPETEITITSGASEVLFNALAATVRPGDEVLVFEPAFDLYQPVVELFGGSVVSVPLRSDTYAIDWASTEAALTERTRIVITNTPHNPSGAVLSAEDMQQLETLVLRYDLLLISDEVYEHIIFDGQAHQSVLRYPKLRERSFAVFSFGKTFHATGWKVGYCIAPPHLSTEFRKVHQYNTFATFTPAQFALADFLENPAHYQELPAFYQKHRDKFQELLAETAFTLIPCQGTYFQLAQYGHLSDENDTDYAERLTREVGVATIPVSVFYQDKTDRKVLRFCFAKQFETMEQAVERLLQNEAYLTKLSGQ